MIAKIFLIVSVVSHCVVWGQQIPVTYPLPVIPAKLDPASCPPTYESHPLILISMDGFRAEYLSRGLTPTIQALAQKGVRAPYMKPSYPSITFPNHYTIATGLYPSSHGIIANKIYDPVFQAEFRVGRPESFKKRWWGGEPIWRTAERQGKRAATFFWPGSEVNDQHPSVFFYYNESIPLTQRVNQVLEWLDLPPEKRPDFMTLYMHEPDSLGHDFGPFSPQVEQALTVVDATVKRLVEGLQQRNLLSCVNLLLVADHGMVEGSKDKVFNLYDFIPNVTTRARVWDGIFARMTPIDGTEATKLEMMRALSCKRPQMRVYDKRQLPIRWHMGTQRRVEDIVLDLDAGFAVADDTNFVADMGDHGYDNYFPFMNALFVGHGPDLQRNTEVEAFQNIELYNLMCQLLGVSPAPNNGTWGALNHVLASPPPLLPPTTHEVPSPVAPCPSEQELSPRLSESHCEGDALVIDDLLKVLKEGHENAPGIMRTHLPWGVPHMSHLNASTILLVQPDSVTAYSSLMKMPLWTSFSINSASVKAGGAHWRSDVRLTPEQTPTCPNYNSLFQFGITPQPLFPPEFSRRRDCMQLPYLMSNAVPFSRQLSKRWQELKNFITKWVHLNGALNIITGPVFDYDADSFVDDLEVFRNHKEPVVPSHMFLLVSRCLVWVNEPAKCPPSKVDAMAFVYPQTQSVPNCMAAARYAQEFSAKVQDVEKITGLKFYPNMPFEEQVRLQVRIHSNIWGRESWWNRLRSDVYGLGR